MLSWRLLSHSPADPDLFARIAMGRLIQTSSSVPLADPFAFTAKHPQWVDHEWLSGVVFWWIIQNTGEAGLILAKITVAALTALFVVCASFVITPFSRGRLIWITICMLHASFLWGTTLRCQAFTYLFLSFFLFAAESYRKHGTAVYLFALPLISVAWINLHGGWALGICTMWLYALASLFSPRAHSKRALVASAMACSLAPLFTPYGAANFLSYLFHALQMSRPSIEEWSPLLHDSDAFAITAALSALLALGAIIRRERDLVAISILLFSAYCGFRHIRLLGFFMIACAVYGMPLLSASCESWRSRYNSFFEKLSRATAVTAAALLLAAGYGTARASLEPSHWKLDLSVYYYPALKWLAESAESGRLLVDFNNGSIALWMLFPNFQVSVDGRYEEVYPNSTVQNNARALAFGTAEAPQALEAIQPTHILAAASSKSLLPDGWTVIYSDARAIILRKHSLEKTGAKEHPPSAARELWVPGF